MNVVWLGPVYKSPNDDNGYAISNYHDIMDEIGMLADWEKLLAEMHKRGIKRVIDLVVNHRSNKHPLEADGNKLRRLFTSPYSHSCFQCSSADFRFGVIVHPDDVVKYIDPAEC